MPAASGDDIDRLTLATNRQSLIIALTEVMHHLGTHHARHQAIIDILRVIYDKVALEAGEPPIPDPPTQ